MKKMLAKFGEFETPLLFSMGVCFSVLIFFGIGLCRLVDGDEGFYLYASKMVAMGERPYTDFFFPQMPLVPYIYAGWFKLVGVGWFSGRTLSALCAIGISILLYSVSYRKTKNGPFSLLLVVTFCFSSLAFGWLTVVKTYALTALPLLASVVLFMLALEKNNRNTLYMFGAGILFGVAGDARLLVFGLSPIYCAFIFLVNDPMPTRIRYFVGFCLGVFLILLPVLWFAMDDFASFWFNNMGYHGLWSGDGFIGDFNQKLRVLVSLLGADLRHGSIVGLQDLILLGLLVYFHRYLRSLGAKFILMIVVGLALISLLPTPTFVQYFCVLVPLVFLLFVEVYVAWVVAENSNRRRRRIGVLLLVYVLLAPIDMVRYVHSGKAVPGVDHSINWKIETINSVSRWIDKHTLKNDPIVSWWPGYLVQSHAVAAKGTENHFSWLVEDKISNEDAMHYHIMKFSTLKEDIKNSQFSLYILSLWTPNKPTAEKLLGRSGYTFVKQIGDAEIYALSR